MNKSFTKSRVIELDDKYTLTPDSDNGVILTFSEIRQRKNKTTELEEDYIFEDKTYHTRISQALTKYVDLTQNSSKSLEDLLSKVDEIYKVIDTINKEFQQFN